MAIKRNLTDKARALILAAAAKGSANTDIYKAIGISNTVWARWMRENPEFVDEIHDARLPSVEMVEAALYKRAIGYEFDCVEYEIKELKDGSKLKTERRKRTVITPDVQAQTFILQNRRPDRWKPAAKVDTGSGKIAYIVKLPE